MSEDRRFTPEQATAMLPSLTESLARIRSSRQLILSAGERVRGDAPANGGGRIGADYLDALGTLRREVERMVADGVILRDPEVGLLDFPSRRAERDVFLCWQMGEETVAFWHGPETGFAGRQPI